MAQIKNLFIDQATTYSEYIQFIDTNKQPISLVGYTVKGQLQKSHTSANASAIFALNIVGNTTGNIHISLTAGDTANIPAGRYVYGIDAVSANVSANGDNVFRIAEGTVTVNPAAMAHGMPIYGGSAVIYPTTAYVDSKFTALTTANVPEQGNLYFTNTRARNAFTAGQNVNIAANGLITLGVNPYTLPIANTTTLGGVKVGENLSIDNSGILNADYQLQNLTVVDQSIIGNNANADINIIPNGTGLVQIPGFKIQTGSIITGASPIDIIVEPLVLAELTTWSTGNQIMPANNTALFGVNANNPAISAPWTVYKFTTNPSPVLEINDFLAGAGVPIEPKSTVRWVGTGSAEKYVIIDNNSFENIPELIRPQANTVIYITRPTVNAGLSISTNANTDITLNAGVGGYVVPHSSIIPFTHNTFSIGTPTKRFKDIWIGAGTIYVLDETLGSDLAIGAKDGSLYVGGAAGFNVGEFQFYDNQLKIKNPARDIIIGSEAGTGYVKFNRPVKITSAVSGQTTFEATRDGYVIIKSPTISAGGSGLNIVGSSDGVSSNIGLSGRMLHVTGNDGIPSRIENDAYGTNAFAGYLGRSARGTAAIPTASQSGDTFARFGALGYGASGWLASNVNSGAPLNSIDFVASQNYTDENAGSRIDFYTSPTNTRTRKLSATISSEGAKLPAGSSIIYGDNTIQTTAWTGIATASNITGLAAVATTGSYSNLSNKLNFISGAGIIATTIGSNVSIDATGVQNVLVANSAGQLTATYSGANVTLSLPQAIATTSSVTFQNLNVTGTFTAANINLSTAPTIAGKTLLLAANATSNTGISGGGIQLGPVGNLFSRSFLYDLGNDRWDTGSAGLNTLELSSGNIYVTSGAHFGNAYNDYDFPNAIIQNDTNENSYSQVVLKNHSSGSQASSDFVAVNNIGTDTTNYIDMGINSNAYNNSEYSVTGPNDGYLYISGGHLRIGTATAGKEISFFVGGTQSSNIRASVSETGLSTVGLTVYGNISSTNNISAANNLTSNTANFTSLAVTNVISGTIANGVVTSTSYSNPAWITSLAASKISGYVVNAAYANVSANAIFSLNSANAAYANVAANGVVTSSSYADPSWITSLAASKVSGFVANAAYANVAANGVVTTTSYSNPAWITSLAASKISGYVGFANSANTVIDGVYTTDTGTVTNTMLSGGITNNKLINSNVIVNSGTGLSGGGTISLGGNITLVNTDLGSSQSIFKNIAVSGQSTVTANTNNDTATFIAGTNMSITTSGKTITFTSITGNTVPVTSIVGANNIVLSGSTGNVTIQRVDGLQNVVTSNASSTYSLSTTDQYFGSTRSITGACTVTLPLGSSISAGKQYIIKDEGGSSGNGSKRITIAASGSDTIDGNATRTITSNYGALTVLWTGTRWSVI